ncbi:putative ribonuclease h protein [Fagus crenata]
MGENWVLFNFEDEINMERVIANGPWSFDKFFILLQRIEDDSLFSQVSFTNITLWAQIHDLPVCHIKPETGWTIGGTLGKVERVDSEYETRGGSKFVREIDRDLGFTNEEANEGTITSTINMVQKTRDNQISYCPDQGIEIEPIQIDEMDTLVIPVPPNASNPILREGDAGKKGSLADPQHLIGIEQMGVTSSHKGYLKFPNAIAQHMIESSSDHCAILFNLEGRPRMRVKRRFHFAAMWTRLEDFREVIKKAWNPTNTGEEPTSLNQRLQQCAVELSEWNKQVYGNVTRKISKLRESLEHLIAEEEM